MEYPYRVSLRRQRNNLTKTSTLIFTHEQLRENLYRTKQNQKKRLLGDCRQVRNNEIKAKLNRNLYYIRIKTRNITKWVFEDIYRASIIISRATAQLSELVKCHDNLSIHLCAVLIWLLKRTTTNPYSL